MLLLTDAATYMTAAGKVLREMYPQLFHVTCVAHLLHNCAQKVRAHFPRVDELIATVKAATVKNADRRNQFSAIGSVPSPVPTRWASWLEAAFYYAANLPMVKEIVESWQGNGIIVTRVQVAVRAEGLPHDLLEIKRCYTCLAEAVINCEAANNTIRGAWTDLWSMSFDSDPCGIRKYLSKRLNANIGMSAIMNMANSSVSPSIYELLQAAQPTSASVERSFSMLSKLLAKDRNFLPQNIEKYIMLMYNKK